jgi:hypothetical protein
MPAAEPLRSSGTRQDTWIIRVFLNGNSLGVWDKKTGGALDSDDIKYYPGGMKQPQSLGGKRTTDNVTLQRIYDRNDDHSIINDLFNAAGKGKVSIHTKPMDVDGLEFGNASIVRNGILKRVAEPDIDSESTSAALLEIEVTISGYPQLV